MATLLLMGMSVDDASPGYQRGAFNHIANKFRKPTNTAPNGDPKTSGGALGGNMSNGSANALHPPLGAVTISTYGNMVVRSINGIDHPTRRRNSSFSMSSFGGYGGVFYGGHNQMETNTLNTLMRWGGVVQVDPLTAHMTGGDLMGILGSDSEGSSKSSPKTFKASHHYGSVLIDNGLGVRNLYGLGEDVSDPQYDDCVRVDIMTPGNDARSTNNTNLYQIIENDFGGEFSNDNDRNSWINSTISSMSWGETTPSNQMGADIYYDNQLGSPHKSNQGTRLVDTMDGMSTDGIATNGAPKMYIGEYEHPTDSTVKRKVAVNNENNAYVTPGGAAILNTGPVDSNGYASYTSYDAASMGGWGSSAGGTSAGFFG